MAEIGEVSELIKWALIVIVAGEERYVPKEEVTWGSIFTWDSC
jgi:hypothetical protein